MKILDRYLMRSLLTPLGGACLAFLTVAVVVNLFEELDTFIDHEVSAGIVFEYYAAIIPGFFTIILPIASLIAVLFCLGGMARRSELIAMTATGISLYRILVPILVTGFALSLVGLALTLEISPRTERLRHEIRDHEIKGRPRVTGTTRRDLNYLGGGGLYFLIRRYDGEAAAMTDVVVQQFAEGTLVRRIDAKEAVWEEGHWVFREGFVRRFRNEGVEAEVFESRAFPEIVEKPEDFLRIVRDPEEMTLRELQEQRRRTRFSGGESVRLDVELHRRFSFPFASFIVILLGAPLTGAIRRGGHALGFGLALLIGFLYYVLVEVGRTYGTNGTFPPALAAWLPNLVFLAAGLLGLVKTRK